MYSIENGEDSEKLNEVVLLNDQIKVVRLQEKLGKPSFHEDLKKLFEPVTDTIRNTSENFKKTSTETSVENNKALENLKDKLLEIMNERVIIARYLLPPSSKSTNPEKNYTFLTSKRF